jgi:hypothetical protein
MHLAALFGVMQALENYWDDSMMNFYEFWGECMEALASADLRDL